MVPGAALFYSGATERRSTLSMIWLPVMTTTVIGVQVSLEHLDNIVDNSAENHL
jgi:ammonia channel protein AmtB